MTLKQTFGLSSLLCFFAIIAYGQGFLPPQFSAEVQILDNGKIAIRSEQGTAALEAYLHKKEQDLGFTVNAYLIKRPINFQVNESNQSLRFLPSPFTMGFYLKLPGVGQGDWLVAHYLEGTDTLKLTARNRHFFWQGLPQLVQLELLDNFPYQAETAVITDISLKKVPKTGFGSAGPCHVNALCNPENKAPEVASAVARILIRNGNLQGWCSGTLINNTAYNYRPYLLSAEHCALNPAFVNQADLRNWIFYFNYQSESCANPSSDLGLDQQFVVGADLVARSNDQGGDEGSDFLLLELLEPIPSTFKVYYAGWNRTNQASSKGLCYHHPQADLKKVSTYTQEPMLSSWGETTPNTHWETNWNQTLNGHGTTEGGSSGSALLDEDNLILGVLTGGASNCSNTGSRDLYGSIAYSWRNNGTEPQNQLAPWLDPENLGLLRLAGASPGDLKPDLSSSLLNIAPNPTENRQIRISSKQNLKDKLNLKVFTLAGQLVFSATQAPVPGRLATFKVSNLVKGLYIVQIRQGKIFKTEKIWIQ
jgi:hypothetical protein